MSYPDILDVFANQKAFPIFDTSIWKDIYVNESYVT